MGLVPVTETHVPLPLARHVSIEIQSSVVEVRGAHEENIQCLCTQSDMLVPYCSSATLREMGQKHARSAATTSSRHVALFIVV